MKNTYILKLSILFIIASLVMFLVSLVVPENLWLLIIPFFVVLILPFLNQRRLIEPICPFMLMYSGLGTSSIRLLIDRDYPSLLTLNGINTVEQARDLLIPVLQAGIFAMVFFYLGYFALSIKPRGPLFLPKSIAPSRSIRPVVFWFTVIGLLAFGYIIQSGGGIVAFITDPMIRSSFSQRNLNAGGSYYWFLVADLMMLANIMWYSHDPNALHNPLYIVHLIVVSALRMSLGSRYVVITFWMALFIIYIIHRNNSASGKAAKLDPVNASEHNANNTLFRWPILRTAIFAVSAIVFALVILAVRNASNSGEFDKQAFQTTLNDVFSPTAMLRLLSGYDFVDADILMLIQRDFGVTHNYFLGRTFLELPLMAIPRFIWPEKPALLARWVGQTYLRSDTTGVPAGITGELYMNFGLIGMFLGMFLLGIVFRWIWATYQNRLTNPKMICLYAIVFAQFLPSLSTAGLTNAIIHYLSFLGPAVVAFAFIYHNAKSHNESSIQ